MPKSKSAWELTDITARQTTAIMNWMIKLIESSIMYLNKNASLENF
jgi:hypothetical protein